MQLGGALDVLVNLQVYVVVFGSEYAEPRNSQVSSNNALTKSPHVIWDAFVMVVPR